MSSQQLRAGCTATRNSCAELASISFTFSLTVNAFLLSFLLLLSPSNSSVTPLTLCFEVLIQVATLCEIIERETVLKWKQTMGQKAQRSHGMGRDTEALMMPFVEVWDPTAGNRKTMRREDKNISHLY